MEVVSKNRISATEVFDHLQDRDDLTKRRQHTTLEYLQKHLSVDDVETYEELRDELEELESFNDAQILKLIEVLPSTEQEVRTFFSKERIKLEDGDIDSVIEFSESVDGH